MGRSDRSLLCLTPCNVKQRILIVQSSQMFEDKFFLCDRVHNKPNMWLEVTKPIGW